MPASLGGSGPAMFAAIPAARLTPSWIGTRVSLLVGGKPVVGGLSDYAMNGGRVWLYVGGRECIVPDTETITRGNPAELTDW